MPSPLRPIAIVIGVILSLLSLPLFAKKNLPASIHVTLSPQQWTLIPLPARTISAANHGDEIWACGERELIAVSSDGGSTWQVRHLAKSGRLLLAMTFADDRTAYAWGSDGLALRSSDGGATWKNFDAPPGMILDAQFSDRKNGLVLSTNWFATTRDGGVRWRAHVIPDPENGPYHRDDIQSAIVLDSRHAAILFTAADKIHGQLLSSTEDGGTTWKTLRFAASLHLLTLFRAGSDFDAYGYQDNGKCVCTPIRLASADGLDWKIVHQTAPRLDTCAQQGCLESDDRAHLWNQNTDIQIPTRPPAVYDWAVGAQGICLVDDNLRCASYTALSATEAALLPAPAPSRPLNKVFKCLSCPQPHYPRGQENVQGSVRIVGWVDEQGVPRDLTIRWAPTAQMGEAALAAIKTWRYVPPVLDHKPIRAWSSFTVDFVTTSGAR